MKDKEGDLSQLSAFAVYNKLIPGVKTYAVNSEKVSKKKRKGERKLSNVMPEIQKSKPAIFASSKSTVKTSAKPNEILSNRVLKEAEPEGNGNKKKRKRKRKAEGQDERSQQESLPGPSMPTKIAKLGSKSMNKNAKNNPPLPLLLPNPCSIGNPQKSKKSKSNVNKKKEESANEGHLANGSAFSSNNRNIILHKKSSAKSEKHKAVEIENPTTETVVENKSLASLFNRKPVWNSIAHGKTLFEWLISPISVNTFMTEYFEKKPLHIKRSNKSSDYYQWILSSEKLDGVLRQNVLKYQKNIDITSYSKSNNVRETQSDELEGRARPAVVWDYYNNGCSIRILNPQTYIKPLWRLNASLQEWFGSFVGANVYLTPPDSQGFAPHYDDIEAFIIQVEGKKHWKLYKPRSKNEELPRFSSNNFSEEKDNLGKPIMDVVVEEGDLLYFPRGIIHQAMASQDTHSLHITLSCQQKNCWGDLLKEHLNNVVDKAMASDVEFRKGLPTDYLSYMGIAHQDSHDNSVREKRKKFGKTMKQLMDKISVNAADFASDQMGKKFIWDSLPPYLTAKEKELTVNEDGEFIQSGVVFNRCEMDPDVEIKLIRKNCIRLVVEEGVVRLYFSTENTRVYHEEEAQYLEMSAKTAPAVQFLISRYPDYVKIDDLPISADDVSEKVQVAADLWERGLLMTKTPLETADCDGDFDSEDAESIGEESEGNDSELEEVFDTDEHDGFFVDSDDNDEEEMDNFGSDNDSEEDIDNSESNEGGTDEDEVPVPILVKRKAKK